MYLLIDRVNLLFCREAYIQNIYGYIHIYTSIYLLNYLCVRVALGASTLRIHISFPSSVFIYNVLTKVASYEWWVFTFSCKYDFFNFIFDKKGIIKRSCFMMLPMKLWSDICPRDSFWSMMKLSKVKIYVNRNDDRVGRAEQRPITMNDGGHLNSLYWSFLISSNIHSSDDPWLSLFLT